MITIMFAPDVLPCSGASLIINEKKKVIKVMAAIIWRVRKIAQGDC